MRSNKGRDTAPEVRLRSAVHRLGLRFRVGMRPLPGFRRTADLVFTKQRVAVFLDGCFWHGCPEHYTAPVAHSDYWKDKVAANVARDRQTDEQLKEAGWRVVRVWEHEDLDAAAKRIRSLINDRTPVRGRGRTADR